MKSEPFGPSYITDETVLHYQVFSASLRAAEYTTGVFLQTVKNLEHSNCLEMFFFGMFIFFFSNLR